MRKSMFIGFIALQTTTAMGAPIELRRVLKDTTTAVALELNPKTVFCTDRGYGNVQLKVSVPDLDWLAHFNHRVAGEGLPCITGGRCAPGNEPGDILDPSERVALASMRVILTERIQIDTEEKTCAHRLEEQIEGRIRGREFQHARGNDWAPWDIEKCRKLIKARSDRAPAKPPRFAAG